MADDPMSNRCHTRAERDETWPLLEALIAMIQPSKIVAIGTLSTGINFITSGADANIITGSYGATVGG